MPRLPAVKPKALIRLFCKKGFVQVRQRGSHVVLFHEKRNKQIVIPLHNKDMKRGTLATILSRSEITWEQLNS